MLTVSLPLYLLLVANAALIVAAAFAVMRVERALREPALFWSSPTGLAMRSQRGPDAQEKQQLERQIATLKSLVNELRTRPTAATPERVVDLSLGRAVKMAKQGASAEALARDCGLSVGEAELLHRLHGGADDAPPMAQQG